MERRTLAFLATSTCALFLLMLSVSMSKSAKDEASSFFYDNLTVESSVGEIRSSLDELRSDVDDLESSTENLDLEQSSLDIKLDYLEDEVDSLQLEMSYRE